MCATIISLVFCNTCHKRIKTKESYTKWEGSIYCEPCFEDYLDMVSPTDLFINNDFKHSDDDSNE